MVKEIIMKDMKTDEMRKFLESALKELEEERKRILQHLMDKDHPNLQMATEVFEIASLLQPVCIKALHMDNVVCAQLTSILVAILNGINSGYVIDEVEKLFKLHTMMEEASEEAPKNKSKMN
jgi:hypothetical protein